MSQISVFVFADPSCRPGKRLYSLRLWIGGLSHNVQTNCDSSEHDENLEFYVRKPSRSEVYACARKLTHDLARRRSASRAAPDKRKPDPAPLNPVSRILSSILNPQSLNRLELSGIVKLYGYRSLGPCFWISSF